MAPKTEPSWAKTAHQEAATIYAPALPWSLHPHVAKLPLLLQKTDPGFMRTHHVRGFRPIAAPEMRTPMRLIIPTKATLRPSAYASNSRAEANADAMFSFGSIREAVEEYSLAIRQKPTTQQYAKRCAAYAHLGDYRRAMVDAETILEYDKTNSSSRVRIKNLKELMEAKFTSRAGNDRAHLG